VKVKGIPINAKEDKELYGRKFARSQKRTPSYVEITHKKDVKVRHREAERKTRQANEKFVERRRSEQKQL
jgi:hypothetical protein